MSQRILCRECMYKQAQIDELKEENDRLKAALNRQKKREEEGYFGSSTPSSKKPVKKNAAEEKVESRGGAKKGHKGHGRMVFDIEEADEVVDVQGLENCPRCGRELNLVKTKMRRVIDIEPVRVKKIVYRLVKKRCGHCKKGFTSTVPGVLRKGLYSNRLLTFAAIEHYIHGVPINRIAERYGFNVGSLIKGMHRIGEIVKDVPEELVKQYRKAPVKHADETTWRVDGKNAYAWLFATAKITIILLRNSRSSKVVEEVLGISQIPGSLNVDRYAGYNKSPCILQYCYAHLLRDLLDILAEFPQQPEVVCFVDTAAPLLKEAMELRSLPISDKEFYRRANKCKNAIISAMQRPATHLAIRGYQDIFLNYPNRLYHWAENRDVPADNNFAERGLRPLVIARKISFGSQSQKGALTRSRLMSVLLTLHKRFPQHTFDRLASSLHNYAANPSFNPYNALFSPTDPLAQNSS